MPRDQYPSDIQALIRLRDGELKTFTNYHMAVALDWGETLASENETLRQRIARQDASSSRLLRSTLAGPPEPDE